MDRFKERDESAIVGVCEHCDDVMYEGDGAVEFITGEVVHRVCANDFAVKEFSLVIGAINEDGEVR